jgi:hypothetical protein
LPHYGRPPAAKHDGRPRDNRLQRRLRQIERLGPRPRKQLMQIIDTFIEVEMLKSHATGSRS